MYDWEQGCRHWEGDEVEIKDPQTGETIRKEIVFAWVTNAHLSEVSAVWDGSTEGAKILKAQRAIQEGQLTPERLQLLENRYRIKFSDARQVVTVGNSTQEAETMSVEKPKEPTAEERGQQEGSSLPELQIRQITELVSQSGVSKDLALVDAVRWLVSENTRLSPLADDGKKYRESLIAEALAEGVRAIDNFKEETYKAMFANVQIETIRSMKEDWAAIAKQRFPGGRQSVDTVTEPTPAPQVNPAAFRA
jgi:hypothetical protein